MKGSAPTSTTRHPALNLLLLVGLMVGAMCVAFFLMAMYSRLVLGVRDFGPIAANPAGFRQGWEFLMVSQGLTLLLGFGGSALALVSLSKMRWADYFAPRRPVPAAALLGAALLVVLMLPLLGAIIEWNAKTHFPSFLHDFEVYAREAEDRNATLMKFLTEFSSLGRFLVGVIVIAVVPAVAEELFFRGVVQRNLVQWFSPHVGIWLGAALFSAIHFQFFGFFPRFLLGLVLGYLYHWSGNLLVPMALHFTQNGLQLLALYLQQRRLLSPAFNPDDTQSMPWPFVLASAVLSAAGLYYLYRRLQPAVPTEMHTLSSEGVTVETAAPLPPGEQLTGNSLS